MLGRTLVVSCFCASSVLAVEPVPLRGSTIKSMIGAGATIELDTPLGTKVPIRFSPDGQMQGEAGAVASYLGAATDTGRWWVSGNKLCQQWTRWLDAEKQCLTLQQNGRQILWESDDGKSGTATVTIRQEQMAMTENAPRYGLGAPDETSARFVPRAAPPTGEVEAFVMSAPKAPAAARPQHASAAVAAAPLKAFTTVTKPETAKVMPRAVTAVPTPLAGPARTTVAPPVRAAATSTIAPIPADPTFSVVGVRASDVLTVRAGPSSDHAPVAAIPPESRGVRVIGRCQDGWCPVEHEGRAGWVNSLYLAEEKGGGRY